MTDSSPAAADRPVDVGRLIDQARFSPFQMRVIALVATTVVLDGLDGQLIGFAIPMISHEWGLARAAFAPVVFAGLLGMAGGSAAAGLLADRYGRRRALLGSVLIFGAATSAVGLAGNLWSLAALRFVTGLGIGGALPSSTTLSAEFSPARRRTFVVTATIVCVPLGGMFAGLIAGYVLPHSGWRSLFVIGGALPLVFSIVLAAALPESPRFLARQSERWPELAALLARFTPAGASAASYTNGGETPHVQHGGVLALLQPEYRRDSIALWCAFLMSMLAVYSAFSWLPSMLVSAGLSGQTASAGLTAYNTGGVAGALVCAIAITRFGSRTPLILCCLGATASALLLTPLPLVEHTALLILGLGVHGFFVNAVQSTMYALCAHVYPTIVRATGTATAAMFGRVGAAASGFVGAVVITRAGAPGFLVLLGGAMVLVLCALVFVRHHVEPGEAFARE